jgi:hypothetical protein
MHSLDDIKGQLDCAIVPWRAELMKVRGQQIVLRVENRAIIMTTATSRDRGASR